MARAKADVFGFDELEKSMKRCEKRYPNEADALLMAAGRQVNKKVKSLTPVKTKKLRNSWRLKKVKLYKGGKVRVVREQSSAPHAHLVELGHEQVSISTFASQKPRFARPPFLAVRGGRTRERGRKLNRLQRSIRGIKTKGRVEGKYMLEKSITEANTTFRSNVEKMMDKLTDDLRA